MSTFKEFFDEVMQDEEIKKYYDELEPERQAIQKLIDTEKENSEVKELKKPIKHYPKFTLKRRRAYA